MANHSTIFFLVTNLENTSYLRERFLEEAGLRGVEITLCTVQDFSFHYDHERGVQVFYRDEIFPKDAMFLKWNIGLYLYETRLLIRALQDAGYRVLNAAMLQYPDKLMVYQRLAVCGIPFPRTMYLRLPVDVARVEKYFSFPVIVKNVIGSHGAGVLKCDSMAMFADVTKMLEITHDPRVELMVQEFVGSSVGRDLRVVVIGDEVVGAMERTASAGHFKANYSLGGDIAAYPVDEALRDLAMRVKEALGVELAGVDVLFGEDGYVVCEVNYQFGFAGFERATGISIPERVFGYLGI